jgi:hypothetical protein
MFQLSSHSSQFFPLKLTVGGFVPRSRTKKLTLSFIENTFVFHNSLVTHFPKYDVHQSRCYHPRRPFCRSTSVIQLVVSEKLTYVYPQSSPDKRALAVTPFKKVIFATAFPLCNLYLRQFKYSLMTAAKL